MEKKSFSLSFIHSLPFIREGKFGFSGYASDGNLSYALIKKNYFFLHRKLFLKYFFFCCCSSCKVDFHIFTWQMRLKIFLLQEKSNSTMWFAWERIETTVWDVDFCCCSHTSYVCVYIHIKLTSLWLQFD